MPITIRELLASDTISQAADKINFNFDQLLLNGGGPQGPQGPQGPPGPIGGRGIRGSVWYEDTSTTSPGNNPNTVPPTLTPEDEDNYLQFNGDVWTYDASIPGWVNTGVNIQGPVGPPGASSKFAEYQASPSYGPAGDTTIFPDEISLSPIGLTQGVRSVLIGGFPEGPAFTPTSIGTNIVPLAIANQLQMPDISMMVHQFNASGRGIVFHGGDATENFEQVAATDLSSIGISNDDLMLIFVPKEPTAALVPADLDGLRILTPSRNQHLQAGKRIWLQAGTSSTQYGAGDLASVWIEAERNIGSIASPTIELRVNDTAAPAYEAELRLGGFNTAPGTSSKQGDFWVEAGLIDILSNGSTTVNSGQGITMNAANNIVATSLGADIRLNAPSGELYSTSQTVDVNATTSIEIDAGTSITVDASTFIDIDASTFIDIDASTDIDINAGLSVEIVAGTTMSLRSDTSTQIFSGGDIDIHSKDANVHIFTNTSSGGDVLIDTNNTGSQIKLETTGSTSPIEFITNTVDSPIVLDANNGGAVPPNIAGLGAPLLARSEGSLFIGTGNATHTFFGSAPDAVFAAEGDVRLKATQNVYSNSTLHTYIQAVGNIDIDAEDDIEILADSTNHGILLKHGAGTGEIDLTSITSTTIVNVTPGGAASGSQLRLWGRSDRTEGMIVTAFGTGYAAVSGTGTDKLILDGWDRTPWTSGPGFDPALDVDAHIHADDHDTKLTGTANESIFASGRFLTDTITNSDTVQLNWIRVGNVVNCTGLAIGMTTTDTVPLPIGNADSNTVRGVWTTSSTQGTINDSGGSRFLISGSPIGNTFFSFSYVIA